MKRFTAVIAAVTALGMATPSWGAQLSQKDSETIILQGEVIGNISTFLAVKFRGDLYICSVLPLNGKVAAVCYDNR